MPITLNLPVFRQLYPQFLDPAVFSDIRLQADFDMATAYVSPDSYGDMTDAVRTQAVYLMAAHLLALGAIIAQNNYQGQVGIVAGAKVGEVSVTLSPPPDRGQWRWWMNTTPYGAQLVGLLEAQSVGGFYVGGLPERAAFRKVAGYFG